jgi:hypothetical protein
VFNPPAHNAWEPVMNQLSHALEETFNGVSGAADVGT